MATRSALLVLTSIVLCSYDTVSAQSSVDMDATDAVLTRRCPLSAWRGPCRRLSAAEAVQLEAALSALTLPRVHCRAARTALLEALRGEVWLFDGHSEDRAQHGHYVLAETARHARTRAPAGVGFRSALLASPPHVQAAVALHEGAHLGGWNETQARRVERTCVDAAAGTSADRTGG